MDMLTLAFALAVFIAVVLFLEGAYLWWRSTQSAEVKRLNRRLDEVATGIHTEQTASLIKKKRRMSESPLAEQLLHTMPIAAQLERLLIQSRLQLSVGQFIGYTIALAVLGFSIPLIFNRPLILGVVLGSILGAIPLIYALRARTLHLRNIERQLPDAFDLMSRALRAGHAFPTAIKMVGDEMKDPIGGEFRILFDEMNYGVPQQTALLNLATRTDSTDLSYFVIAVLIQRESGGNLAELLDNIASIVRARLKLYGEIRTLSAEGRLSAWILGCLPFATAALINIVNPDFMKVLWEDPAGLNLIYAALVMMVLGVLWMRKIIRIRV